MEAFEGERQGSSRGTLRGCRGERGEATVEKTEVSRNESWESERSETRLTPIAIGLLTAILHDTVSAMMPFCYCLMESSD